MTTTALLDYVHALATLSPLEAELASRLRDATDECEVMAREIAELAARYG